MFNLLDGRPLDQVFFAGLFIGAIALFIGMNLFVVIKNLFAKAKRNNQFHDLRKALSDNDISFKQVAKKLNDYKS